MPGVVPALVSVTFCCGSLSRPRQRLCKSLSRVQFLCFSQQPCGAGRCTDEETAAQTVGVAHESRGRRGADLGLRSIRSVLCFRVAPSSTDQQKTGCARALGHPEGIARQGRAPHRARLPCNLRPWHEAVMLQLPGPRGGRRPRAQRDLKTCFTQRHSGYSVAAIIFPLFIYSSLSH